MRPVLAHCDREGLPCYLESSKERNVPFYRRHGFEVVQEVPLGADGPDHLDDVAGAAAGLLSGAAPLCGVDALRHGQGVVDHQPEHVNDRAGRCGGQAAAPLGHADPSAGEPGHGEHREAPP